MVAAQHFNARQNERGNVLFLILVATALFAALSYVVAQSSRSGSGDAAREKARMAAADILNQATAVQTAVGRLLINGCNESQLSFESDIDPLQENPNAPAAETCHVFKAKGGGVPPRIADPEIAQNNKFIYAASSAITNIGTTCTATTCADLTMNLQGVSEAVCEQLNAMSGYRVSAASTPTDTQSMCPFVGTFDCNGNGNAQVVFAAAGLAGRNSVCYRDTVHGLTFTHVIFER